MTNLIFFMTGTLTLGGGFVLVTSVTVFVLTVRFRLIMMISPSSLLWPSTNFNHNRHVD